MISSTDFGCPVEIYPSRHAASAAAADGLLSALKDGLSRNGVATLAAAGGATPCEAYKILSAKPFEWSRVAVTLTDDRLAPPTHPESRAAVVGRNLISPVTRGLRFFPLWSASATAESAAFAANEAIAPLAPFDAALLGMDLGGGFAALTPECALPVEALSPESRRLVVSVRPPEAAPVRLSLTLNALARTRRLTLLLFGPAKLDALRSALGQETPISSLFQHASPRVIWSA